MSGFKKNTAVTGFPFSLVALADGTAVTTGTVNGFRTLDGVTQTALTNTEVHEGNGQWSVDLTAAEMNGDVVGLLFTHTLAVNVHFTIKTDTKIVSELNDLTTANVNAQVLDVMDTDTFSLPAQGAPPLTPTFRQAVMWLYKFLRNEKRATATEITLYNDAGTVVDSKRTISDDGTTYTEEEVITGP
jgi:hypothetical protein